MKKLIVIFIVLATIITNSCSQKKETKEFKVYDVVNIKEVSFSIDDRKVSTANAWSNCGEMFDYAIIDEIETLIIPVKDKRVEISQNIDDSFLLGLMKLDMEDVENNYRLAFYDMATQKEYHSIPLRKDAKINNFAYVNKDSILVFYCDNFSRYTDLTDIQILDFYGNTNICNFDLSQYDGNAEYILPFRSISNNSFPVIFDNKIFLKPNYSTNGSIGTKDFLDKQYPIFASYDMQTKEVAVSKTLKYPNITEGTYYPRRFEPEQITYCLSGNNLPVLRFFYSSDILEWDYKNDNVIKHTVKSRILDSIPPLRNENSSFDALLGHYLNFTYDPFNKIYYSYLLLNNNIFGHNISTLVLADENFNYLSEIVNPKIGGKVKFTKDFIISCCNDGNSVHVSYKKLIETDRPLQPYLDSVKNTMENVGLNQ